MMAPWTSSPARRWYSLCRVTLPWRRRLVLVIFGSVLGLIHGLCEELPAAVTPFRFGFSSGMLVNVSHGAAKAAVKVWAQVIAGERDIPADPDPSIFEYLKDIVALVREQRLDAVAAALAEYREPNREQSYSDIFLAVPGSRTNVECLLLVPQDSVITNLAGPQGTSVTCCENTRTSLALPWLDTLLIQQGHAPAADCLGRVNLSRMLSAAVLPGFFRKADACLVDRMGFETRCELNPQVGSQRRPLADSPVLVPMLFRLRADYVPAIKDRIVGALADLHKSPVVQQVLAVLQFESIRPSPSSCLQSGLELLSLHDWLRGRSSGAAPDTIDLRPAEEAGRL